jgi:hypothetical protein
MKFILISFILSVAWAAGPGGSPEYMASTVTENAILSSVKEMEIEQVISSSSEFKDCESQIRSKNLEQIQTCFRDKLNGKSKEQLESLSDKLGLQDYKLVQGKNIKDITQYLSDRLYKAMKGVDRSEEKFFSLKNKKLVDQRVYFDLYRTQLTKNALFEISRFCFTHFRYNGSTTNPTSFFEYWQAWDPNNSSNSYTDLGDGFADTTDFNSEDKTKVYRAISKNIGTSSTLLTTSETNSTRISEIYVKCVEQIGEMCKKYVDDPAQNVGKRACLTKERMIKIKKAVAKTDEVLENWIEEGAGKSLAVNLSTFESGSTDDNSIDALTNYASSDFLERSNADSSQRDKAERCANEAEIAECEEFFLSGDLDETKKSVKVRSTLRNQLELATIQAIKTDRQKLEEYLRENGYINILNAYKENSSVNLEELLNKEYQARMDAMDEGINDRLSNRQLRTEAREGEDSPPEVTDDTKKDNIENNAKDFINERARLAQVVMFNNIITSHLNLSTEDGEKIGRNRNVLKKEVAGLESASIEEGLFANLKEDSRPGGEGRTNFSTISLDSFIDPIIGNESN